MNEMIKLRAWDTETNNWVEGLTLLLHTSGRIIHLPSHIILTFWTGLQDKHGNEIYNGDIVKPEDALVKGNYEVYWNYDKWGLHLKNRYGRWEDYDNGDYYHGDAIDWEGCEVIGNVYENPEILEQNA